MTRAQHQGAATGTRARLGAAAIGLGGLAFGLIQILQGTVSAFDPRPEVAVLCAVAVGLAALTVERARNLSARRRRVAAALRVWPPQAVRDTDVLALGVFPDGAGAPYRAREQDEVVDAALARGGVTVVTGPARAGKSRVACEAARRVWPDRHVAIPADGAGLRELVGDPAVLPPGAIWWLDDLERFRGELDGPILAAITDPARTVVVTVREDAWAELLQASGDDGERGRRLLAAADVIAIPPGPPGAPEDAGTDAARIVRRRRRPDTVLTVGLAATAASVVVLGLLVAADGFSRSKPPPISAQVADIRADLARGGRRVLFTAATQGLHGTDDRSQVFVVRSDSEGSDELRIYDEVDGRLQLRFAYRPRTRFRPPVAGAGPAFSLGDQQKRALADYIAVEPPVVVDADRDGAREVLFSYRAWINPGLPPFRLPLAVAWDDRRQAYVLSAVLGEAPAPLPPRRTISFGQGFRQPFRLFDALAPERRPLADHGVSSMIVLDDGLVVTATQVSYPRYVNGLQTVDVAVNLFRLSKSSGRVSAQPLCVSPAGPLRLTIPRPTGADFRFALRDRARHLRRVSQMLAASGPGCFY
jgi:hypothetical protein